MKLGTAVLGVASMLMLGATTAHAALDDAKALDALKKGGCTACHAVDHKVLGPAYKDVAAKRKGEADAVATLEKSVRGGSKGTYGPMPMPPTAQAKISDADLHELLEWVLTK